MKKASILLLALIAFLFAACSAAETVYTCSPVTDAEASASVYARFRAAGELSVTIPGLKEGFVPQGITYLPQDDAFLFAGYSGGEDNSALLSVSRATGELLKQVKLNNVDGSKYTGHAGGV